VVDELGLRITLGRLLEHLAEMEKSARSARELIQSEIWRLDATRSKPLPRTRDMIAAVMRAAGNVGLARSDIIAAVDRDYGVLLAPNNATTCLLRMRRAGLARFDEQFWFLT
jgi:hypothetical protein